MDIRIAKHSGFCFGVKNTIKKIEETLSESKIPVYSIGLPVHNTQVADDLKSKGLIVVSSPDEISDGVLVVRAHGLSPVEKEAIREKGVRIVDATCPLVRKTQNIASELSKQGYEIILSGKREHPEVKAVIGCIVGPFQVCSLAEELDSEKKYTKVALLSQTTHSIENFHMIAEKLLQARFDEVRIMNTICESVEQRKTYAEEIACDVDCMLVVGGKMSSNTKRLYDVSSKVNKNSYYIETARDIDAKWLDTVQAIGITAGASTPEWVIDDIVEKLRLISSRQTS